MDNQVLLIIFVALTGVAVLIQACVLFGIYIALQKSAKSVLLATEDMKATVVPMMKTTRELMERIGPQLITVTTDLAEMTQGIRKESASVRVSISEIMERVNKQTAHLDAIMTSGLNSVDRAGVVLESAVAAPVRQVNGVVAAVKAMIDTYRRVDPRGRQRNSTYSATDKDMFI
jgi:hypothetical protein